MKRAARKQSGDAPQDVDAVSPSFIAPMEALLAEALPEDDGWQFEPKWDGFRCLAVRADDEIELFAKSGKPLGRYFPEIVALLGKLPQKSFIVDGELVIPVGDALSFEALQMRLHPADSRVRKLSAEMPANLVLFDILIAPKKGSLIAEPLTTRREALESFHAAVKGEPSLRLSPMTRDRRTAQRWLDTSGGGLDGVIAKRLDAPYEPGERAMLKVKRMRTADCVVGGFRYGTGSDEVGSLLLGLYNDEGLLDHVGFSSSIAAKDRPALTKKLEALREPPGFTGNAPGGPSRWSTERTGQWEPLKPVLVVEVRYDHVSGGRFRHGTRLVRWRPDKSPRQCTFAQLELPASPRKILAGLDSK